MSRAAATSPGREEADASERIHDRRESDPRLARLDLLADLLDTRWRIPGTPWRFGLDGVAAIVPGIGDMAGAVVAAYLIMEARRLGAPAHLIGRMIWHVFVDTSVGSVPIAGTAFSVAYKANKKNMRLLRRHLEKRASQPPRVGRI